MPAYKYKTTSGKTLWYASFHYTDWTGKNVRKMKRGFATRREALEYEAHFKDSQSKDPTILFSSLVRQYYADCETRLKPTTLQSKKSIIDLKILPYFGNTRICDIDVAMIRKWQNEFIDFRDKNGEGYQPTYLRSINTQLTAILAYACRFCGLASNPSSLAGPMGETRAKEMSFWTHDQYRQFRSYVQKPIFLIAFDLLFYGGLREGELLALTPDDFDAKTKTMRIDETFAVVDGVEYMLTPKTKKSDRTVTLPKTVFDEVAAYVSRCAVGGDERIFYFRKDALLREFRRCTDRAGLPQIRIHDLRGSHASMLADLGVPIKEVANRLGHESTATTLRTYTHSYPHRAMELAAQIDGLIAEDSRVSQTPVKVTKTDENKQKNT